MRTREEGGVLRKERSYEGRRSKEELGNNKEGEMKEGKEQGRVRKEDRREMKEGKEQGRVREADRRHGGGANKKKKVKEEEKKRKRNRK